MAKPVPLLDEGMANTRRRSRATQAAPRTDQAGRPSKRRVSSGTAQPAATERAGWWTPGQALETGLVVTALVVPLVFSRLSSEAFELPKTIAVRVLVVASLLAALVATVARWPLDAREVDRWRRLSAWRAALRAPRDWPLGVAAAVVALAWLLATAFSVSATVSWWGIPLKWAGARTQLAYVALFAIAAVVISRRSQVMRLVAVSAFTAALASLYALVQRSGLDPLKWAYSGPGGAQGDIAAAAVRPASTLGNPNFFADYLALTIFLTLGALVAAVRHRRSGWWPWAASLALQAVALLLTQTRGAWLGCMLGAVFFVLLLVSIHGGAWRRWLAGLAGGVVALALALWLAAPVLPQSGLLGRIASLARPTEGSGGIRLLVWNATIHLWLQRPLLGFGPDTYSGAIQRVYDPALVLASGAAVADRAENATLDALQATGVVGTLALAGLIAAVAWYALQLIRPTSAPAERTRSSATLRRHPLVAGLTAALVAHVVADHFSLESPAASSLAWLLAGALAGSARAIMPGALPAPSASAALPLRQQAAHRPLAAPVRLATATGAALVLVLWVWMEVLPLRASIAFDQAVQLQTAGHPGEAVVSLQAAVDAWPNNPNYWVALAGAQRDAARTRPGASGTALLRQALEAASRALEMSPQNPGVVSAWAGAAAELSAQTNDDALLAQSRAAAQRAIDLAPRFWRYWAAAADTEQALGNLAAAKQDYAQAAALNDVDWVVWSKLGDAAAQVQDPATARSAWQHALSLCDTPLPTRRTCSASERNALQNALASLPR